MGKSWKLSKCPSAGENGYKTIWNIKNIPTEIIYMAYYLKYTKNIYICRMEFFKMYKRYNILLMNISFVMKV